MNVVDVSKFEDSVVIHFATEGPRINAYTLASTLVAVADAAKAANSSLNLGYDIEIVVEAIGPGSFRVNIKALYSAARNLFSKEVVTALAISVIANYIYERALSVDHSVRVVVNTDEVVIETNGERIIVPRNVYDATRRAEKNPHFVRAVARTFEAVATDEKVTGFGLVPRMDSPPPEITIPREIIGKLSFDVPEDPTNRVIVEQCELQIVKAILERGHRKWEFMWRGIKISAPITCDRFYEEFFAHQITIAPGDSLKVRLAIKQVRDDMTGIYSNAGYEVVEVFEHSPQVRQMPLPPTNDTPEPSQ
jgi:hypothetical protein